MITEPVFASVPASGHSPLKQGRGTPFRAFFAIGAIATVALVGLRYKVGADWYNYQVIFNGIKTQSLLSAVQVGDPAFQFLNWVAYHLFSARIWLVNLVSAAVFGWG